MAHIPEPVPHEPGAEATPARPHTVPPEIARSWLLVPATKPDQFEPPAASGVDAVIIDVEDAVSPPQKAAARDNAVHYLSGGGEAWVRVNDATTPYWPDDLAALSECAGLRGVMLAKSESGYQVDATADRLPEGIRIVALIESAMGLEAAPEIARAEPTFRLAFGSGDFRRDTGMSDDPMAMAYPRARLVVCSRAARLAGPIDGPTVNRNESILRRDSALAASMGMTGRLCLHPDQAIPVDEALSPTADDITWAHDVIAELGENGENVRDGSDLPRLAKAKKIRTQAAAFGM